MLVNEAGDVVDLAVDDHPQIISVLVLGDLLEGEDLLLGSISRNGGGVRHCVSIAGWECRGLGESRVVACMDCRNTRRHNQTVDCTAFEQCVLTCVSLSYPNLSSSTQRTTSMSC